MTSGDVMHSVMQDFRVYEVTKRREKRRKKRETQGQTRARTVARPSGQPGAEYFYSNLDFSPSRIPSRYKASRNGPSNPSNNLRFVWMGLSSRNNQIGEGTLNEQGHCLKHVIVS